MTEVNYSPIPESKISFPSGNGDTPNLKLVKNEVLKGKVLKTISSNKALLLIKGQKIMARSHLPLTEGSEISLKVEKIDPNPILKLLGTKHETINTIKTSMILTGIKKNLWKTIIEHIDRFRLSNDEKKLFKELADHISKRLFLKPTPDLLRELIDKSGLGWEAKLREIITSKTFPKANINELISGDLKGLGSKFIASMKQQNEVMNQFVSMIKNIQLLNRFGLEQDGKIFIPIPMHFPDGLFTVGQLLIHLHQNKKRGHETKKTDKDLFKVSFLLELSNLGPLRADLSVRGEQINGRFLMVEEHAKLLIETNLPSFVKILKERGFSILHLECQIKDPGDIKDPLIKKIIREEIHNISLVA